MKNRIKSLIWLFSILRIVIGWHFLYEGISKLFNPNWSSFAYLMESKWLFSGFFHWLISNNISLKIIDILNIWGLIIIGTCLFIGCFTRIASISGAFILVLYYVANPPFVYSSISSMSNFYIINYNLIEAVVLIILATLPKNYHYGIQRYLVYQHSRRKDHKFPPEDNHEIFEKNSTSRRELIKNLAVIPFFGAVFFGMAKKSGWFSFEEDNLIGRKDAISGASFYLGRDYSISELKGKVPKGNINHVEISRIIPGGNIISGQAHSRYLIYVSSLLKKYFTDEKVIETFWMYEACGINSIVLSVREQTLRVLKEYRRRGGKLQWLAQAYPKDNDFFSSIQLAVDNGAVGAFVEGGVSMKWASENRLENLDKPIQFIKSKGLIAGIASHRIEVPVKCVQEGVEPDFFFQTFHNHQSQYCTDAPEKVKAFFKTCKIPWIAYKVLAAGAIKPEDGFRYTFEGGADFACVGMFDFQVVENANITFNIFSSDIKRDRELYG